MLGKRSPAMGGMVSKRGYFSVIQISRRESCRARPFECIFGILDTFASEIKKKLGVLGRGLLRIKGMVLAKV